MIFIFKGSKMLKMRSSAYNYLIKILSSRDYSEHKLREKLKNRKYSNEETEEAIKKVKEQNYLREDLYTEARIKGFMNKNYSTGFIKQKLNQEKITVDANFINNILTEHGISKEEQIKKLIDKKNPKALKLDQKSEAKILRYLISKGHDYSTSNKILKNSFS